MSTSARRTRYDTDVSTVSAPAHLSLRTTDDAATTSVDDPLLGARQNNGGHVTFEFEESAKDIEANLEVNFNGKSRCFFFSLVISLAVLIQHWTYVVRAYTVYVVCFETKFSCASKTNMPNFCTCGLNKIDVHLARILRSCMEKPRLKSPWSTVMWVSLCCESWLDKYEESWATTIGE